MGEVAMADVDGAGCGLHACMHRIHESRCGEVSLCSFVGWCGVSVAEVSEVVSIEEVAAAV